MEVKKSITVFGIFPGRNFCIRRKNSGLDAISVTLLFSIHSQLENKVEKQVRNKLDDLNVRYILTTSGVLKNK